MRCAEIAPRPGRTPTGDGRGRVARHRHEEWLKFLRLIKRSTPRHLTLHLIVDNYATHNHPDVQKCLAAHSRVVLRFTSTGASWLNMVERFSATSPTSASSATASPASQSSRSLSSGPPPPRTSSPKSHAPKRHSQRSLDKCRTSRRTTLVCSCRHISRGSNRGQIHQQDNRTNRWSTGVGR
jgi:hypothetical protein